MVGNASVVDLVITWLTGSCLSLPVPGIMGEVDHLSLASEKTKIQSRVSTEYVPLLHRRSQKIINHTILSRELSLFVIIE